MTADRYGTFEHLLVEVEDAVALCVLNRPDVRNAVDRPMHHELEQFLAAVRDDRDVRAVILTGAGAAFCAGGDTKAMQRRLTGDLHDPPDVPFLRGALDLVRHLLAVRQPIIAAVNGDAVGLGATLALLCDVVISSSDARFGDPHVRAGLVAGDGGCLIWPLLVGPNRAKEFLMTGRLLDAAEARDIGLVNQVVAAPEVVPEARALAVELADLAPLAVQWTKLTINKTLWQAANLVLDTGLGLEAVTARTADHLEGVRAINEQRRPRFTGD